MSDSENTVVVVGQAGRDLVLRVDRLPDAGGSTTVGERLEMLGGKGANQAVGLRQLGAGVALIAVVGDDDVGRRVLRQADESGIDVSHVARRGQTALLVDVVDGHSDRRLLEDVPAASLVTAEDVEAAADVFDHADTVCLQLQQPSEALLAAAELARDLGVRIVLDGGISGDARDRLLDVARVVRADATEAEMLTGIRVHDREDAERAAKALLDAGPQVVAIEVPKAGDLVAWPGGRRLYPHGDAPVVDLTGAGDAFLAGLVSGLRSGASPEEAGRLAAAAAAATVTRLGGRPDLASLSWSST